MYESDMDYGPISYCLFHSWFKMDGFDKFLEDSWCAMNFTDSNSLIRMKKKLQFFKNTIKPWVKNNKKKINEAKQSTQCKLIDRDKTIDQGGRNEEVLNHRISLMKELNDIHSSEVLEFSQKAQVRWSMEGDENSKYIHRILNRAVLEFFTCGKFPPGCKSAFITLIPKTNDTKVIKDFLPISLIGSIYKIIAKILAILLSFIMSDLVSDVQTAFVTNRQILDGPFILNDLISWCKHKKIDAMIFKVDFEKAFDSVRWDYLNAIGLKINLLKSKLTGIGVNKKDTDMAASIMGCSTFFPPFQYLDKSIKKMVWIGWDKIMAIKKNGGLGVSSLFIKAIHGIKEAMDFQNHSFKGSIWHDITRASSSLNQKGVDLLSFINRKLGNGERTLFWNDIWLGEDALKTIYPRLYALELQKDISVAGKMKHSFFSFSFRRLPRGGIESKQYSALSDAISDLILPQMQDRWAWSINASGEFLPLNKVDGPVNADSHSEVHEVFNETLGFMASTSFKVNKSSKSGSVVGNKNLYEQWKETYNEDSYDDDDFGDCCLTDA
nr:RNA-directed DNA polymerase, eukaryota, reverse transcriptase zinc-binding domain protein [Tanacetum cinerariifolium]